MFSEMEIEQGRSMIAELREEFRTQVFLDASGKVRVRPPKEKPLGAFFLARIAEHWEAIAAALQEEATSSRRSLHEH